MATTRKYNSAGGVDINVVIGGKVVGELQSISYSVTREKGPIYTLGSPDPRSFARGKRGIAGTLIFATFDRTALLEYIEGVGQNKKNPHINKYDIKFQYGDGGDKATLSGAYSPVGTLPTDVTKATDIKVQTDPWYVDQMLPFDVYIVAANEYGSIMKKAIAGVEILNEGGGVSVDDLMIAEQYTYIATGMTPWTFVQSPDVNFMGQSPT